MSTDEPVDSAATEVTESPSADVGPPTDDDSMTTGEKRLLIALAVIGLLILAAVVVVRLANGSDEGPTDASSQEAFTGTGELVETPKRLSPTERSISDPLDRSTLEGGPLDWSTVGAGEWTVRNGVLTVTGEPAQSYAKAVVTVPKSMGADWAFSITIDEPAALAGFVWGVADEKNYWEFRAVPDYAAVAVNHVIDGEPVQVRMLGPTGLAKGQRYTIQHRGSTVVIAADGEPFLAMTDPTLAKPRRVGIIASTDSTPGFTKPELASIDPAS